MKLNYTSIQHPVVPIERPLEKASAATRFQSWFCPLTGT